MTQPAQPPESPDKAGLPRTKGTTRSYRSPEVRVIWEASRCIHTGICLIRLPEVFDAKARPWIDVSAADPEEIAAAIRACPTGALRYDGDGVEPEQPDIPTTVEVRPNGPLFIRGSVQVKKPGNQIITEEYRMALCRCGASENKPFCDNSHRLVGFTDR